MRQRFTPRRFHGPPRPALPWTALATALCLVGCHSWSAVALEPSIRSAIPRGSANSLGEPRAEVQSRTETREIDRRSRILLTDAAPPVLLARGDRLTYDYSRERWSLNGLRSFSPDDVQGMYEARLDVGRTVLASILFSLAGTAAGVALATLTYITVIIAQGGWGAG